MVADAVPQDVPPTPAMASPVISWLFENVDVCDWPNGPVVVVDSLGLAAIAVPIATAPCRCGDNVRTT